MLWLNLSVINVTYSTGKKDRTSDTIVFMLSSNTKLVQVSVLLPIKQDFSGQTADWFRPGTLALSLLHMTSSAHLQVGVADIITILVTLNATTVFRTCKSMLSRH